MTYFLFNTLKGHSVSHLKSIFLSVPILQMEGSSLLKQTIAAKWISLTPVLWLHQSTPGCKEDKGQIFLHEFNHAFKKKENK